MHQVGPRDSYFEAENVQDGDGVASLGFFADDVVHSFDEPREEARVNGLGNSVPSLARNLVSSEERYGTMSTSRSTYLASSAWSMLKGVSTFSSRASVIL